MTIEKNKMEEAMKARDDLVSTLLPLLFVLGPIGVALIVTGHYIWAGLFWIFFLLVWGHLLQRRDFKKVANGKDPV